MEEGVGEGIHRCWAEIEELESRRAMYGPDEEIESALRAKKAELARWREIASRPVETITRSSDAMPAAASTPDRHSIESEDGPVPHYPLPEPELIASRIRSLQSESDSKLIAIAKRACDALHPFSAKKGTYADLRPWIHAAHSLMTERETLAPVVRPVPPLGGFFSRAELAGDRGLMLNDRQLFDLEYANRHKLGNPKPKWQALLRSEVFDRNLAARFICTVGKADNKVDALRLREDEQMRLCAIRSDSVRKRWERLERDADTLAAYLEAECDVGGIKIAKADIPRWREEFIALELAARSPSRASVLLGRLYGRFKPANQLANRKIDLRRKMLVMVKAAA